MAIHATCSCGKQLLIPDAMAGQNVACLRCHRPLDVPRLAVVQAAPHRAQFHLHRGPVPVGAEDVVSSATYGEAAITAGAAAPAEPRMPSTLASPPAPRRFAGPDVTDRLRRMRWSNRVEDLRQVAMVSHELVVTHPIAVLVSFALIVLGSIAMSIVTHIGG